MILKKINDEIISCYKNGESDRRIFLQTIKSLLLNKLKEKRSDLSEQEEVAVLQSELKRIQEAATQYEHGGRADLVGKANQEISVLKSYLPAELSEKEIRNELKDTIERESDKSFGNIMKCAMLKMRGRADGSKVSDIVRELLSTER